MKFIDEKLMRPGRLTEKVDPPCLIDMIHGAREEVVDACIRLINDEHEKMHQLYFKVMKNREPSKQMFNIVHPDWLKEDFYAEAGPRAWLKLADMFDEIVAEKSNVAINNHICPHCKNDRVSNTEKSCWLCGGLL